MDLERHRKREKWIQISWKKTAFSELVSSRVSRGGGGEGEVVAIRSTATRRAKRENQLWGQDCTGIHPRLHPCVSFSFSGAFSSSKGWTKMGVTFVKLGINDGWVRSLEWTSFDRLSESFPREEKGREGNGAFVCQINMKSWGER